MSEFEQDEWTRRRILAAAGGAAASLPSLTAYAADDERYVEPDDLFIEQQEPTSPRLPRTRVLRDWPLWWEQKIRPPAIWAPELDRNDRGLWVAGGYSTDTVHLGEAFSVEEFTVTAETLRKALALAFIPKDALGRRVLFGIRGAVRADCRKQRGDRPLKSIVLTESEPNHFDLRCVLGVWDQKTSGLWAGPGSTVPNVAYMFAQAQALELDTVCNILPAGVYKYVVGTHRNGKKSRQPGAFRLVSSVVVQRNYLADDVREFNANEEKNKPTPRPSNLAFSLKGLWKPRGPDICDNIRAAYYMPTGRPRFSSAGCQVIEGTVLPFGTRERPVGAWRQFRIAAGLKPSPSITKSKDNPKLVSTDEDGREFHYVLLTARELRLAAGLRKKETDPELQKLRRGSQGPVVKRLNEALKLSKPGDKFDQRTQDALIRLQERRRGYADGVVTRDSLKELGLPKNLFD